MTNYPPGVTDQNFDELCWGETFDCDRRCTCCKDTIADEWSSDLCESCEAEEDAGKICDCGDPKDPDEPYCWICTGVREDIEMEEEGE